jgi:acyl-coenzyme A thioesterase PaaI-like protein
MDITEIPFNRLIGIRKTNGDSSTLLELSDSPEYQNHLQTVHAAAQLALAEASSAEYLLRIFKEAGNDVVAVVRKVQAKFKKPVKGKVYSRAVASPEEIKRFTDLLSLKGKALITVTVDIVDAEGAVAMRSLIEWFIKRAKTSMIA